MKHWGARNTAITLCVLALATVIVPDARADEFLKGASLKTYMESTTVYTKNRWGPITVWYNAGGSYTFQGSSGRMGEGTWWVDKNKSDQLCRKFEDRPVVCHRIKKVSDTEFVFVSAKRETAAKLERR